MIKYIIIGLVIMFVLWKGKPYIKGWIISRQKRKDQIPLANTELIYTPVLSSRTFYFAVEITEKGNGQATLTVVKNKQLENID